MNSTIPKRYAETLRNQNIPFQLKKQNTCRNGINNLDINRRTWHTRCINQRLVLWWCGKGIIYIKFNAYKEIIHGVEYNTSFLSGSFFNIKQLFYNSRITSNIWHCKKSRRACITFANVFISNSLTIFNNKVVMSLKSPVCVCVCVCKLCQHFQFNKKVVTSLIF